MHDATVHMQTSLLAVAYTAIQLANQVRTF